MKTPLFVMVLSVPKDFLELRAIFPPSYKIPTTFTTEISTRNTIFEVCKNPFSKFSLVFCNPLHILSLKIESQIVIHMRSLMFHKTYNIITNNELERIWKELVIVYFEVLNSCNCLEGLKQIKKNPS